MTRRRARRERIAWNRTRRIAQKAVNGIARLVGENTVLPLGSYNGQLVVIRSRPLRPESLPAWDQSDGVYCLAHEMDATLCSCSDMPEDQ